MVHGIAWWGMQVFSVWLPYHLLFTHWDMNSPERWGVRLLRALLAVVIVLGWASYRKIAWHALGLGGQKFWRNLSFGVTGVAAFWFSIVTLRGTELWAPHPMGYGLRIMGMVVSAVSVVAQQVSTFGLLERLGARHFSAGKAFLLGWLSFGIAHLLLGNFLSGLVIGLTVGLLFGLLLWWTENLGAGLGIHFGFYLMLSVLGWGAL